MHASCTGFYLSTDSCIDTHPTSRLPHHQTLQIAAPASSAASCLAQQDQSCRSSSKLSALPISSSNSSTPRSSAKTFQSLSSHPPNPTSWTPASQFAHLHCSHDSPHVQIRPDSSFSFSPSFLSIHQHNSLYSEPMGTGVNQEKEENGWDGAREGEGKEGDIPEAASNTFNAI